MNLHAVAKPLPQGLEVERRDSREGVEVTLPFKVFHGEHCYKGIRLSRTHLVVANDHEMPAFPASQPIDVSVRLTLSGTEFVLSLSVMANACEPGMTKLDIADISEEAATTLSNFVRIAVTGWLPRAEDLAKGWDSETPLKQASTPSVRRGIFPWLVFGASALLLAFGVTFTAQQIYYDMTRIRAEAAAISAPRTDLISHEYGSVAPDIVGVGAKAKPGQFLARVVSDDLEASMKMEEADLALLKESESVPSSAGKQEIIQGRIAALERRRQALSYRSQCECKVIWAAPPNTPVAPGTLLVSLVASGADQIRVEALVSPADALNISPGQMATVTPAGSAIGRSAHVGAVKYEFVPAPKIGLGKREGFVTVELVIDGAVDELIPGTPADVLIWK
ncbi:hypothetical protein DY251_08850 [Mesorhizobium denitrificans]|uniref:Uncharacterized protein n=2 Tax=Phyllobacteriaceae TaxID=69277 RepID=A0A371XEN4_9HYPH|nr:hypothetical protein DY251_08850 [Mesorhizobium denitrificans]